MCGHILLFTLGKLISELLFETLNVLDVSSWLSSEINAKTRNTAS